jgi:hypothetical protein
LIPTLESPLLDPELLLMDAYLNVFSIRHLCWFSVCWFFRWVSNTFPFVRTILTNHCLGFLTCLITLDTINHSDLPEVPLSLSLSARESSVVSLRSFLHGLMSFSSV